MCIYICICPTNSACKSLGNFMYVMEALHETLWGLVKFS